MDVFTRAGTRAKQDKRTAIPWERKARVSLPTGNFALVSGARGPASGPTEQAAKLAVQVMSTSIEPRLAGRQPSGQGGVLRVKTGPFGAQAGRQACTGR